jgi:Zn-dependent protease with chaperone function
MSRRAALVGLALAFAGCAAPVSGPPSDGPRAGPPRAAARIDPAQAERLRRLMVPLVRAMNTPRPLDQVRVAVVADPRVNAGNAGAGQFFVTTGLLEKANDDQLQAVLAHEVAHEDLGHVAKAQAVGAGLNIGMIILEQLLPGSAAVTPLAGELIFRGYTRQEEYAADAHGVELLERIGRSRQQMIDTLTWLMRTEGSGGGGFFSTHPATGERIEALRRGR